MPTLGVMDHLLAVSVALLSLAGAWTGRPGARANPEAPRVMVSSEKRSFYLATSANLWILGGAAVGVWLLHGRSLADLGFRSPDWTPAAAIAVVVFLMWLAADTGRELSASRFERTRHRWQALTPFMPANRTELGHYSVLAISPGFAEEIVYRGFVISYLSAFVGVTWPGIGIAVAIPAAFFGLLHLYQGLRGVLGAGVGALAWGVVFVETGSLWPLVFLHASVDFGMGLAGLRLLGQASHD